MVEEGSPPNLTPRTISLGMSAATTSDQLHRRSTRILIGPSVTVSPPARPAHRARIGHVRGFGGGWWVVLPRGKQTTRLEHWSACEFTSPSYADRK